MNVHIAVVGDALLDVDLVGRARRLAPDAPVPVLEALDEYPRPGGAALAATLAAREGARVSLITALADDDAGRRVRDLLAGRVELHLTEIDGSTPVKQRVRAGGQSIVRLDTGGKPGTVGSLPDGAVRVLAEADAILVSDYGRGLTGASGLRRLLAKAPRHRPVVWDPHPKGAAPVPGVQLVTPNLAEARAWARDPGFAEADGNGWVTLARLAGSLVERWRAGSVAMTLGARGALLSYGAAAPVVVPARSVAAGDTCGAGDQFSATAALMLAGGAVTEEAVERAVEAASGYVAAGGATTIATPTMRSRGTGRSASEVVNEVHRRGGVLVATGGCFDLLHAGHVACLQAARGLGDALVVCLNSDESVRRLKGPGRPVQPVDDRVRVLEALECVDAVEVFEDDSPDAVIRKLRPDVWAKGGDYAGVVLPEEPVLSEWDGQAVTLPYVAGRSTTTLVHALTMAGADPMTERGAE